MVCLWFPRGSRTAVLTVMLMVLSPPLAWAGDTPTLFMVQSKSECHFSNGTEQVRFLDRYIYWLLFSRMASLACPRLQSGRDTHSIFLTIPSTTSLLVEPTVTVYPAKPQPLQHHSLLVCSVTGFYPGHIEVRWFRNGQEEEAGVVSTGLIPNGDWTFQTMVMLEVVPQSGEVYTCRVEHPSRTRPVTVEWRAQDESSQGKMLSGIGGFVLGLLFLGVGLFVYFRNQEGHLGLQPTGLLS
nr:DLA class II histocompatibility antigen, DR-1 beta chain-like [Vicugna pacos]